MMNLQSFENDPVIKKTNQNSNFGAIKVLLQTENHLRAAQNRIKVLQANDTKNARSMKNKLQSIERIQKVREAEVSHNILIEDSKKRLEKQYSQHALKNKQMKSQHQIKKEEHIKEIREGRKMQYLQTEQNSEWADKTIQEHKSYQIKLKGQKRVHINHEEEKAKENVIKFYQDKQSRIKENKIGEVETLKQKEKDRQKELTKLGSIEMELINRQSKSQAAYQEVKQKLDSLLTTVKQNARSKQSLKASFHSTHNNHEQFKKLNLL